MPMHESKMIKSCLNHCQATLQDLQDIANTTQNQQARSTLSQAVQSLSDCIQKCQNAASQV